MPAAQPGKSAPVRSTAEQPWVPRAMARPPVEALPAALIHLRGLGVGLLDPGRYDLWAFWGATGDMGVMKALNQRRWPSGATVAGLIYLCIGLAVNAAFLLVIMQGWLSQKKQNPKQHQYR